MIKWIWLSKLEACKHTSLILSLPPHSIHHQVSFRWYYLKSSHICHLLTILTVITLILIWRTSIPHLDYCDSTLAGLPNSRCLGTQHLECLSHCYFSALKMLLNGFLQTPRLHSNSLLLYISLLGTAPWSEPKLKTYWIVIFQTGHCFSCL